MIEFIYLIYIAFRFGYLAKRYSKNVYLWVTLSGIIYMICIMVMFFNVQIFSTFELMPKLEDNLEQYSMWIPVIAGLFVAFIIHRIVEKSFKKDQTFEELENEIKVEKIEAKKSNPSFFVHFHKVNNTNIHYIRPLAEKIWAKTYGPILTQDQIDYMIPMMYNNQKIFNDISNGQNWEIMKVDNVALGYLHYYLEDESKVFLSKIYVDTENQQKGLGNIMLDHVIEFAQKNKANYLYLTVNKNNQKAIDFYERNGFVRTKEEKFDIGNGYVMDDYIYQYNI